MNRTKNRIKSNTGSSSSALARRREFLKTGSLVLIGHLSSEAMATVEAAEVIPQISFALVTDLHYADKPPAGSRYYQETLKKLDEARQIYKPAQPEFLVELGDLIDSASTVEAELKYLKRINAELGSICENRHYVLGNHCVSTLTKQEFLGEAGKSASYYSFESGDFHFIVLDACFRSDGVDYGRNNFEWTDSFIPEKEIQWLKQDLASTRKKTIVFAHQRLDVANNFGIKNALEVRKILEQHGHVLAVFQGHSHKNDYHRINGIDYITFVAMVEGSGPANNGYSLVQLGKDGTITVNGYRNQNNYALTMN